MDARTQCLRSKQKLRRYQESCNGYVRCITCGKILRVSEAEGGHFISRRNRAVELEDDNIWPQCTYCNQYKNGEVEKYRANLEKIIGPARLARIELMALAYKGSDDAYELLDPKDRVRVRKRKLNSDYLALKRQYDAETRRIRREKGV